MAFIVFNHRYKGKLGQSVPADKARKIQAMLDNPPDDITEEQGEFLLAVHRIYPGKDDRPDPDFIDTSHLLHTGRTQGKLQAIPERDQ